jgi:hypothetical protein
MGARSEGSVDIQIKECEKALWSLNASGQLTCGASWQHLRNKQEEVKW